jgi:hypothetical protein
MVASQMGPYSALLLATKLAYAIASFSVPYFLRLSRMYMHTFKKKFIADKVQPET